MVWSDSRISASRLEARKKAKLTCSIVLTGNDARRSGEVRILVDVNKQTEFFCYRSLLLNGKGVPINWIMPITYANGNWALDSAYILDDNKEKQEPELNDLNKTKLDAIVDMMHKKLPNANFKQRKITPAIKAKLKKEFSREYVESIDQIYYRTYIRLILPFNPNNH